MTTVTNTTATTDLRHEILAHDKDGNPMYIKIRLNDECTNGHQDFSITCNIYEKGKPKTDRYYIMGGCCHDEIIAALPYLKIFVSLHLCDYKGIPMYAVENGFYHLTNGFNDTKPDNENFKAEFCDYYRVTSEQFNILSESKNKIQYAINLEKLGILSQWEEQANEAIKILEEMTGNKFVADSIKTQYHAPTPEELKEEQEKQINGYYTPEAEQLRQYAKMDALLSILKADRDKVINKVNTEYEVKRQVLNIGGEVALNNCIFYDHNKTLAFNWRSYDNISQELINKIVANIELPEGVTIENKNK